MIQHVPIKITLKFIHYSENFNFDKIYSYQTKLTNSKTCPNSYILRQHATFLTVRSCKNQNLYIHLAVILKSMSFTCFQNQSFKVMAILHCWILTYAVAVNLLTFYLISLNHKALACSWYFSKKKSNPLLAMRIHLKKNFRIMLNSSHRSYAAISCKCDLH